MRSANLSLPSGLAGRVWRAFARRIGGLRERVLSLGIAPTPAGNAGGALYRLLFVCRGNACRSPLAMGIMRQKLARAGLLGTVWVESAGTHVERSGSRADWRARCCARRHGINIEDLRRRQFTTADFGAFEKILVMDRANHDVVVALAPSPKAYSGVRLILEDSRPEEVPDPAEGTNKHFEEVYRILDVATNRLMAELEAKVS